MGSLATQEGKLAGLSEIDRNLLKIMLTPNGESISTKSISGKLGIPVTTIRRRRKRLESTFLKLQYILDIEKFGWRRVDFFYFDKERKDKYCCK